MSDRQLSPRVLEALSERELVVVSNRQPYAHNYEDDDGEITVSRPAGGLTAGLDPVMQRTEGTWIAWGDGDADFEVADDGRVRVPPEDPAYTLSRVDLSESDLEGYYYGYSNQALWPLCHGMIYPVRCDGRDFERYRAVNRQFAKAVTEEASEGSLIWFQDYHFALAPRIVRREVPEALLTQFWHIPWPAADTFEVCPQADPLLDGLLANDLLVFHIPAYVENFLDCVEREIPEAAVDRDHRTIQRNGRTTTVRAFPLGIDAERTAELASESSVWADLAGRYGIDDVTVALGVDRLDYTKGIPERIDAIERFFEENPERRGEFTYVQNGSASRSEIASYEYLQQRVDAAIGRVNRRFGAGDWQPIVRIDEMLPEEELYALYRHSDLALVSALRDGMNLVAKEYVASQLDDDGILLLSKFAGAHEELGEGAVTINPFDTQDFAEAIERALALSAEEREARMATQRQRVGEYDLFAWMDDVLETALDCEGEPDLDRSTTHV
ncbi:bifunctional trehalose-6-phosphate synthase/phosphatase [Halalkalicoccus paucihalophilus]|uniref:Bifunctional trehalose-6-phosphate synthase/phosphatase n=1 Tax=Halalkalicoccus paucihalophilus TaxID=1008153 RepID=A0A151AEM7_9EURY|nr:trehalose-6-phosphate synthase [Halalkalicoccus paucihalophilus]KYH25837.1 bifunctional trehalose-6-phosphate synthase/phosphatase [Halalkalicoccus paucihalophilus]